MNKTNPRRIAAGFALCALSAANFILLRSQDALWHSFRGDDGGVPSRATIWAWDALQWTAGVVGLPVVVVALVWYLFAGRPLRDWRGKDLGLFLLSLALVYLHLRWSYEWARETHLAVPNLLVRVVTVLSLNAAVYTSVFAVVIIVLWLKKRNGHRGT